MRKRTMDLCVAAMAAAALVTAAVLALTIPTEAGRYGDSGAPYSVACEHETRTAGL